MQGSAVRLRAGLRVIVLGPGEIQLGVDGRFAARLSDLTPTEVEVLCTADRTRVLPSRPLGLDPKRWSSLIANLSEARLTDLESVRIVPQTAGADSIAWGLVDPDGQGHARIGARRLRQVAVVGLGPTGVTVAVALAAAGVGTLTIADESLVRPVDVGSCGYRWSDVGQPRAEVAARILRDVAPSVTVRAPGTDPDIVVLVDGDAADPLRAAGLVSAEISHLSVVLRDVDTVVGPLVTPETGPCLHCLDLHRTDIDPRWPEVLARLAASPQPPVETSVVAGIAGHLAAGMVLTALDRGTIPPGLTWEIGVADPVPRARIWTAHPECSCGAATERHDGAGRDVMTYRAVKRASADGPDLVWS